MDKKLDEMYQQVNVQLELIDKSFKTQNLNLATLSNWYTQHWVVECMRRLRMSEAVSVSIILPRKITKMVDYMPRNHFEGYLDIINRLENISEELSSKTLSVGNNNLVAMLRKAGFDASLILDEEINKRGTATLRVFRKVD